jgi:hypothetical protein
VVNHRPEVPAELCFGKRTRKRSHCSCKPYEGSPATWRRKVTTAEKVRKQRPQRRKRQEEDEVEFISPGPIPVRVPQVENRQAIQRSPVREDRNNVDTPTPGPSPREAPSNHRRDPNHPPADTPRSRREMDPTRDSPPPPPLKDSEHACKVCRKRRKANSPMEGAEKTTTYNKRAGEIK